MNLILMIKWSTYIYLARKYIKARTDTAHSSNQLVVSYMFWLKENVVVVVFCLLWHKQVSNRFTERKKIYSNTSIFMLLLFFIWSRLNFIRERDKRAMKSKSQLLALTAWLTVWRTQWEFMINKTLFIEKLWSKNKWDQHFCWICAIVVDTVQSINKEKKMKELGE